jgi:hypothetical protein
METSVTSAWGSSWSGAWSGAWGTLDQDAQNGKSGYWRLFYYQLQEAELDKRKAKPEQPLITVPEAPSAVKRKRKQSKPAEERREEQIFVLPPFTPKRVVLPYDTFNDTEKLVADIALDLRLAKVGMSLMKVSPAVLEEGDDDEILLLLVA